MKKCTFVFRLLVLALIIGVGFYVSGCSKSTELEVPTTTTTTTGATTTTTGLTFFSLTSSAFINGGTIPNQYANTGHGIPDAENTSVPLIWSNPPAGTITYAITMTDDSFGDNLHWMVVNIPVSVSSLVEGASPSSMPSGSVEIMQYEGPYPPAEDGPHFYIFTLWALSGTLDDSSITDMASFQTAINPVLLGSNFIIGTFDW